VIRTCDVTLKDNLLYDPLDLNISAILDEHVDKLIETLELLETQVIEIADDDDLLETIEVLVLLDPIETATLGSTNLETP
jgi:hypothetical protein